MSVPQSSAQLLICSYNISAFSLPLASILIKQNKIEESKILLEAIIKKKHQFYSPLSLYLIIDNDIENDNKKIISFFDQILKNNSISNDKDKKSYLSN